MTSYTKIGASQSMHIYLKNNPAKFHPDPSGNGGALGFFEDGHSKKSNYKMSK